MRLSTLLKLASKPKNRRKVLKHISGLKKQLFPSSADKLTKEYRELKLLEQKIKTAGSLGKMRAKVRMAERPYTEYKERKW